ncbi:MAG: helix-turn-helix transcriptional regulator [Holophagaceae bacterium]|nr:helix-turn-helix transcriptional regulator [Holophagaceae bacterium]
MPRPQILPLDGIRRTITLPPDLDELLSVEAARTKTSISLVIVALVRLGIIRKEQVLSTGDLDARVFPKNWNGSDLRERLLHLRMRQRDLAKAAGIHPNTLNSWIRGHHSIPANRLPILQKALLEWVAEPDSFRIGGRSPWS